MALYLREKDVRSLERFTMPATIQAIEQVMGEFSTGAAVDIPRVRVRLPEVTLHMMQGAVPSRKVLGYKAYTTGREGPRVLVYIYSAERGSLEGVIESGYMSPMRTGAAAAIATKRLSRPDAVTAGVIGSGWQAVTQLRGLCEARPLKTIKVFSRNREKLEAFCAEMQPQLKAKVVPAGSAREAVEESDIVTVVTTSAVPVLEAQWLRPGVHINAVGSNSLVRQELDEQSMRRADLIVVDSRPLAVSASGDLFPLLEKGRLLAGQLVELGEIIAGRHPGRQRSDQITLFESQGMVIQDLMIGSHVLAWAREQKVGEQIPLGDVSSRLRGDSGAGFYG